MEQKSNCKSESAVQLRRSSPHTVAQPSLCVLLTPQLQSPLGELGLCAFVIPTVLSH